MTDRQADTGPQLLSRYHRVARVKINTVGNKTCKQETKVAISISVISKHNSFRVLFDKIASVYFTVKIYLYFSTGNGQATEPALCQLYRHAFALCNRQSDARTTRAWDFEVEVQVAVADAVRSAGVLVRCRGADSGGGTAGPVLLTRRRLFHAGGELCRLSPAAAVSGVAGPVAVGRYARRLPLFNDRITTYACSQQYRLFST